MSSGRTRIGRAAIAELMYMKTMLARTQAGDFRLNLHSVGDFSERDGAGNVVALGRMEHGNGF